MINPRLGYAALATLVLGAGTAMAKEEVLEFRLVTQQVGAPMDVLEIGGHKLTAGRYMGVAVFTDGRIAHKTFVHENDETADAGTYKGYSTYTFQNGDSLTLSYTGAWDSNGERGDYRLISGTGTYEGATGTGSFRSIEEPWEDAYLLEGSFKLDVATH